MGVPCLTMANYPWPQFDWIKTWDPHLPDSNCVKFQISWLLCISLHSNDQKKIEFDLQAFTRIQNHPIESDMMRELSEKGHCFDYSEVKWSLMYMFLIFLVMWILDYSKVSNKSTRMLTHFEVFEPPWWHFNHCPGYLTLYWQFWSLVRNCISNNDFFWSLWHSTT